MSRAISGVNNNSSSRVVLFWDRDYAREAAPQIPPRTFMKALPTAGGLTATIDNHCSSMRVQP